MTSHLGMMTINEDLKPRHLVFSKAQRLITFMQNQKNGIPLKNKKNFLTTVNSSFTGSEYIGWLCENICDEGDSVEALHLGTFLCMYGYIYPVDLKSFVVKDDKSCLYKFQSPYYWPSKNLKLTNESYIIYLLKRSKRNKAKHGLEEYEQTAFNKLQIVFSDKMGFVHIQADEQVKQVKHMKRDDKLHHDLQERAFWRVHRPPPNHVKYLEEGPSRYFQPSQMSTRKKKNRDLLLKRVQYLRKAQTRPRMKFSKSLEIFFQHNSQYRPYDMLLDPSSTGHPGNPWITDDDALWEINRRLVEVPTEMRVKKWAISFEDLLKDETGRHEFEHFLKKEYSQENITFYKACKELIVCPVSKVNVLKTNIERKFLTFGAQCEVNIDCKTMEIVTQRLKDDKEVNQRYIFQPAMDHVYSLMKKDSYTRFIRSDQYKQLLQSAQTNFSKKKLNIFGSNRKKTPSPQVRRRGSTSSDNNTIAVDGDIGGPSYHSYSTGNLRDMEEKPKRAMRASNVGSDSSIYLGVYEGSSNSPSLRRRVDEAKEVLSNKEARRRSNLDVPRATASLHTGPGDTGRKSDALSPIVALNVPRTNIVTPWEGQT